MHTEQTIGCQRFRRSLDRYIPVSTRTSAIRRMSSRRTTRLVRVSALGSRWHEFAPRRAASTTQAMRRLSSRAGPRGPGWRKKERPRCVSTCWRVLLACEQSVRSTTFGTPRSLGSISLAIQFPSHRRKTGLSREEPIEESPLPTEPRRRAKGARPGRGGRRARTRAHAALRLCPTFVCRYDFTNN